MDDAELIARVAASALRIAGGEPYHHLDPTVTATPLGSAVNAMVRTLRGTIDALENARLAAVIAARTDSLTSLPNRIALQELLAAAVGNDRCAVLIVDVDRFKDVNDRFGHDTGDAVLIEVSRRIAAALTGRGLVGRWGGEEFLAIIHAVSGAPDLRMTAERVVASVRETTIERHEVTVSVGCASDAGDGVDGLVARADLALYTAKRRGRDRAYLHADVRASDRRPEDPAAVRTAQCVALVSSLRGGAPELHSQQVADLAAATAHQMGLEEATVMRCRLAGWLHDVGATAIPDAILTKPGALDGAEWDVMRTHAEIGAKLVSRLPGLEDVAAAVRSHHERFDGSGYPDNLAGQDIVIEARVVAVADAFATMTSDRLYARARPRAIAQLELLAGAGTHFDPSVVDACMAVLEHWHELTTEDAR